MLVNYYRDGGDYIGLHADREVGKGSVAAISFGAPRDFLIERRADKKTVVFPLRAGDFMWQKAGAQQVFKHAVPKLPKKDIDCGERISLTFRRIAKPA